MPTGLCRYQTEKKALFWNDTKRRQYLEAARSNSKVEIMTKEWFGH